MIVTIDIPFHGGEVTVLVPIWLEFEQVWTYKYHVFICALWKKIKKLIFTMVFKYELKFSKNKHSLLFRILTLEFFCTLLN
tara:strand:+ start:519 stop:761 length:243 start_codon:yes stop_codon:yes gene_type:complete